MQFLKTLFWILIAVVLALFASRNWFSVTLNLWGNIQADIKLPLLLAIFFLIGFLPTWLLYRARLWTSRRQAAPAKVAKEPATLDPAVDEEQA